MKDFFVNVAAGLAALAIAVALLFLVSLLPAAVGALVGYILTLTPFAGLIVTGVNSVLGTALVPSSLVAIGAALGFVGSFFKGARPTQKPAENTVRI